MTYCVEIQSGMWAFMGLLAVLSGLVLAGVLVVSFFERRAAAKERAKGVARRKVFVSCAVRVGPRMALPTRAANDAHLRS